ncbi:unnamed protein product [Ectocarpus sp. 12 AP-2014]
MTLPRVLKTRSPTRTKAPRISKLCSTPGTWSRSTTHRLDRCDTQALKVIHRLEMSRRKGVEGLRKEQDRQKEDFITESVLRLIQGSDAPDGDRHESSGVGCSASADERGSGENRLSGGACNPLVWQAGNAGLVDKKVAKLRVQSISYPGTLNASRKHSATHGYG